MAPKKRPASNMAISISGGKYIEEQGLKDLLEKALAEIEETKPANCVEFLQGLLEESGPKKAKKDEEACWTAFPSPGDAVWRQNAQQRAKSALEPFPGKVSIPCNASPGATRSFPVDPKDTALVLIDMQTDFLEPTGRVGQHYKDLTSVRSGMAGCQRLLAACRAAGLTIAHSRSHRYGSKVLGDLVGTDDEGYELHPLLRAQPGEIVVDKWTYGAFASTFLERELRKKGVKRILLCGVLTNVCVFATASQAVDRFISVCLVEDACAAFTTEWHQKALSLLNDPQIQPGHERGVGLYFGEVTQVEKVEAALKDVKP
ncbi:unnamed protein product [Effrenium voratum]|nr:unnamed protein product [Effrenium voratum]|mmetsp:Transcript_58943/g.140433  ORF Transcript_58943/g.140433 Transcript_58943/m.140433 type:complete len:316 (-) Transcript_58943:146-1093(-)|eukprot:CAMPEP_0181444478 /NCGR_PEP_ID=MMETSP1110-20121109/25089_1 /TAXON_ID=174948 /ORGANISM="Symbiodinium sp., Strain CCMP421" /LENGTH=315 /DNA_ID=CAMNT_0023568485 /DNA_START=79 /DNA_END=1026 /DNA_ORIENTATION=-